MSNTHYSNICDGVLSDYITPDKFRTILPSQRDVPLGPTEIPVEINIKKETAKRLSFRIPWDGIIYACARGKEAMKEKLGIESDPGAATLSDWDDKFLLIFEQTNGKEGPVFNISTEDVIELLENCWRAPAHRITRV